MNVETEATDVVRGVVPCHNKVFRQRRAYCLCVMRLSSYGNVVDDSDENGGRTVGFVANEEAWVIIGGNEVKSVDEKGGESVVPCTASDGVTIAGFDKLEVDVVGVVWEVGGAMACDEEIFEMARRSHVACVLVRERIGLKVCVFGVASDWFVFVVCAECGEEEDGVVVGAWR